MPVIRKGQGVVAPAKPCHEGGMRLVEPFAGFMGWRYEIQGAGQS